MVGTVTLSAASVNAGNTARERQLYRETLAMTSAANLLRQEVQALNFIGCYTKTETVTTTVPDDPESGTTTVTTAKTFAEGECTLAGSSLFEEGNLDLKQVYFANQPDLPDDPLAPSPAPVSLPLSFPAVVAQNIPEVTATLTVETDYTLTIVLSCGNSGMTMTFAPKTNTSTEIGPPAVTSQDGTSITKTVTTYSTALTWDAPVVTEGGAS